MDGGGICLLALWTEGGELVLWRDINLIEKWGVRNHWENKKGIISTQTNSQSLHSLASAEWQTMAGANCSLCGLR